MFKVGDKVRIIGKRSHTAGLHCGMITTIKGIKYNGNNYTAFDPRDISYYRTTLEGCRGIWPEELEIVISKTIVTELDWLDAIQSNFKEGV